MTGRPGFLSRISEPVSQEQIAEGFYEKIQFHASRINSCRVAKDRLSTVVLSDRLNCTPEMVELMKQEILSVMEKYLEIDRTRMTIHLEITTKEEQGVKHAKTIQIKGL